MPPNTKSPSLRDNSFLSPSNYDDDDTSSMHSDRSRGGSDQETDSEDDVVLQGARSSADIRAHDRGVLLEEEERDKLLENASRNGKKGRRGSGLEDVVKRIFKSKSSGEVEKEGLEIEEVGKGKTERRKRRRERRRTKKEKLFENAAHGEDGQLMLEMEEGGMKEGSSTGESTESEGSEEIDRRRMGKIGGRRKKWRNQCFVYLLIAIGFSILVLVAYKLSRGKKGVVNLPNMLGNGTAVFAPTTILISLDGFRADFLNRGITPRLNKLIQEGVSPLYMNPSFPSVTFPNHYTLATGLYPESHGIVGNTFWDGELQQEFFYTHTDAMQPKWWGGEPIWVTAENQGIRTAIHMWPGSEAHIGGIEPAFLDKYNGDELLPNKVSRILGLLDRPGTEDVTAKAAEMRPQLIAAYVPNVDADGHRFGPNSTEIKVTISDVDTMLDQLFLGLEARNLTNIVNIVVVSDHGMATTSVNRLIQLEDLIDTSLIAHTDGWPLFGLRPKNPKYLNSLYTTLLMAQSKNPNFEVYLRDENMPERYHFSKNKRIAPLWIVPKTGWAIVTKEQFDVKAGVSNGKTYSPKGLHGYDHEHPLMRAIFIARGPAFPHTPGSRVEPFQNIEVYNIVCDSLNLTPNPNNGTLRLPLKTTGLHTPENPIPDVLDPEEFDLASTVVLPLVTSSTSASVATLPTKTAENEEANNIISISPIEASSAADPNVKPPVVVGVDEPSKPSSSQKAEETTTGGKVEVDEPGKEVERPTVVDETTGKDDKEDKGKDGGFVKWLESQIKKMKGWIGGKIKGGDKEDGEKKEGN